MMRIIPHLAKALLVCGAAWSLLACEIDCEEPSKNLIRIKFFRASNLAPDTLAFAEVKGIGSPLPFPDSLLYTQSDTLSVFELPVATSSTSVRYQFSRLLANGTTLVRSLTLGYQVRWEVIRPNCGLGAIIENLNLVETTFDSVAITKSTLSNDSEEIHLHIFD